MFVNLDSLQFFGWGVPLTLLVSANDNGFYLISLNEDNVQEYRHYKYRISPTPKHNNAGYIVFLNSALLTHDAWNIESFIYMDDEKDMSDDRERF